MSYTSPVAVPIASRSITRQMSRRKTAGACRFRWGACCPSPPTTSPTPRATMARVTCTAHRPPCRRPSLPFRPRRPHALRFRPPPRRRLHLPPRRLPRARGERSSARASAWWATPPRPRRRPAQARAVPRRAALPGSSTIRCRAAAYVARRACAVLASAASRGTVASGLSPLTAQQTPRPLPRHRDPLGSGWVSRSSRSPWAWALSRLQSASPPCCSTAGTTHTRGWLLQPLMQGKI